MREFRLIFGASTPATAAVLAIFMGGLGAGGALIGRRADAHPRPLALYGLLEILIAATAALTPFLLAAVRSIYIAIGGSGTIVRLLLSALVLLIPTVLMGGTLPAAVRAIETADDPRRRRTALLYGINTLGAVAGVLVSTFVLLERFGNDRTLWLAAFVNAVVGAAAYLLAPDVAPDLSRARPAEAGRYVPKFILIAAAVTGFAFFLLEIVWYRMLSPLLGGTTFMFGLVLAIALIGIGIGGALYSFAGGERLRAATTFALTCTIEALTIAIPFALGDRLALLANDLRATGSFGAHLLGWAAITAIVVLPTAIVAGFQFPLLIALLGSGRERIGREVGLTYAWNTGGAIAGSLLGGFVLLPLAGATGCWKLATFLLLALGVVTFFYAWREQRKLQLAIAAIVAVAAVTAMNSEGPSAVWRHSGIGAGEASRPAKANERTEWLRTMRRTQFFEADGRESSIALMSGDDLGLLVNGKSDGSARADAGTQVMGGMLGALLHPHPRTALVIGLGTGSTAGWMASIPTMQRVDAVELEPVIVRAAEQFAPVNQNATRHPKVRISIADAREQLLTTRETYDVIFSEPSNPYRAGVASLYTREFYAAAANRLRERGVFVQWMQMYSIDRRTVETIYASMIGVFPHIDTWTTNVGDVVLVASRTPIVLDVDNLRARIRQEPYRGAVHRAWRVESAEGLLAHFIGSARLARTLADGARELNTDDRAVLEFSFARTVGRNPFRERDLFAMGAARLQNVRVDWNVVEANRASLTYLPSSDPRAEFMRVYASASFGEAVRLWRAARWQPANTRQTAALAHTLAITGDEAAVPLIESLRAWQPVEADALLSVLRFQQRRHDEAAQLVARSLLAYRDDPWPLRGIMELALVTAAELSRAPAHAPAMLDALSRPYAARQLEEVRKIAYTTAAWHSAQCGTATIVALQEMEPHVPWSSEILQIREACYRVNGMPQADVAKRELDQYEAQRLEGSKAQSR